MVSHKTFARRMLLAAVGTGAVLLGTSAPVHAQPPPNCTAADLASIMSGITAATSAYLFTHPPVNEFFTSLKDVPQEEKRAVLQTYVDANPQVKADLEGIRQPAKDFRSRCG
ncbi:MAG: heme-binding protein [Mycobacterium sp.]